MRDLKEAVLQQKLDVPDLDEVAASELLSLCEQMDFKELHKLGLVKKKEMQQSLETEALRKAIEEESLSKVAYCLQTWQRDLASDELLVSLACRACGI